jgi:hypothetical protein
MLRVIFLIPIGGQPDEKLRINGIKPICAPYFAHEALKNIGPKQLN